VSSAVKKQINVKSNKFWLIVLGGIMMISMIAAVLILQAPASYARIYKDGKPVDVVDLSTVTKPYMIILEQGEEPSPRSNVIEVERGRIRMYKADCPDGTCVRQGWVMSAAIPIVCLPNRVVITLEGNHKGVDAVVR